MTRSLSDEDVEAVALRVVDLIGERLMSRVTAPVETPPAPSVKVEKPLPSKQAYSLKELAAELGISKVSVYRLEARGLIRSLPYLRTKVFARSEVERFLREGLWEPGGQGNSGPRRRRR